MTSADGKITSGATDILDSDKDWKRIAGVKEGLYQYYELERSIALCSLNTGRVMEKIGINARRETPKRDDRLTFFIIDRKPHLDERGIRYLSGRLGKLFIVTNNTSHPAFEAQQDYDNVQVVFYKDDIDLSDLLTKVKHDYGYEHLVIESGGTMNALFVRQGLIDHLIIVIAPLLVGGRDTSSLIDGLSFTREEELTGLRAMKLTKCEEMKYSYVRLQYDLMNNTKINPRE